MSDMSAAPDMGDDSGAEYPTNDQGDQDSGDDGSNEICVKIEKDLKTGEITVGQVPYGEDAPEGSDQDEQDEASYMQPAKSIDDALRIAKGILSQNPNESQNNAAFEGGFQSSRGGSY